jgi:hypothetical protein
VTLLFSDKICCEGYAVFVTRDNVQQKEISFSKWNHILLG